VSGWRGTSVVKLPAPLVLTLICSQRAGPVNGLPPKSTSAVNKPLLTPTALRVTVPPMLLPAAGASKAWKVKSYTPLAGAPLSLSRP
jgi:hypothetical protein